MCALTPAEESRLDRKEQSLGRFLKGMINIEYWAKARAAKGGDGTTGPNIEYPQTVSTLFYIGCKYIFDREPRAGYIHLMS